MKNPYYEAFNGLYGIRPIEKRVTHKMNERIQQLEKQATTVVEGWSDENGTTRYYEFNRKKFAELIIKECIDIAQDRANFPGFPPNDVNDIIDEIREHFGVEE